MFNDELKVIVSTLRAKGLQAHVARVWVYKSICPVVDFSYKGLKFGFNLLPAENNLFSVDIVRRQADHGFSVTSQGSKQRLGEAVSLEQALEILDAAARKAISGMDQFLASGQAALPHLAPDLERLPKTQGGQKRVGVITLPFNSNIGGNLQGYALMEVLRQLGHLPVLVNRRHPRKVAAVGPAEDARLPLIGNVIPIPPGPNRRFIESHITPISREFVSSVQLSRTVDRFEFDAIIAGSDQVWRPKYARSLLSDFFLGFLPETSRKVKRISYAASFGAPDWEYDREQTRLASTLAKRFDAISVREDSAVDLCRNNLGVAAQHVLDPTMLLTADHYARLLAPKAGRKGQGQLLAYVLDRTQDKGKVIGALSAKLNVGAYSTNGLPFDDAATSVGDKSVEGWLASIYDAVFVITDSFHGTVFSILFNKPFIAYGNPSRGMARFTSLLKMVGLEDRLVVNSDEIDIEKMLQPIDWAAVNRRLDALRIDSKQFLISAVSGDNPSPDRERPPPTGHVASGTGEGQAVARVSAAAVAPLGSANPLNVLCTGCGVCVSESAGSLRMIWNDEGFLVPQAAAGEVPPEAVRVCPFNSRPEPEVKDEDALAKLFLPDAPKFDPRAGCFNNSYIGYSKKFRPTSSSGGIATYVFEKLLTERHVDYLFVVQSDGGSGYRYQVFDKTDDIRKMSKTRYYPVSLDELFAVIDQKDGRVAVSGVACFIKAIRLKQYYHPELKARIPFLIGIICGGLKSRMYTDFLAQSAGIDGPYFNPEYRVKDPKSTASDYSFGALDGQDKFHKVKMSRLGDMWGSGLFKARACDFCTDVLTELADISLGDAWLAKYRPDGMGNSVVVTRSALADKIIRSGMASGELVIEEAPIGAIAQSQGGGANHKHNTVKFRVWAATYFSDLPLPVIRPRVMKSVPLTEALVQLHKERTRAKSLAYWRATGTVGAFRSRMRASRKGLAAALSARQEVRDGAIHPLAGLWAKRPLDVLKGGMAGAAGSGRTMARWVLQKIGGQQFNLGLLRSALFSANVVSAPRQLPTDRAATEKGDS